MNTPVTHLAPPPVRNAINRVIDITDRLPARVETAETFERPYAPTPETFDVAERWTVLAMTVLALICAGVFATSFAVLGLPSGGRDGLVATGGVGFLVITSLFVAYLGAQSIREDFARFDATH